MWAEAHAVKGGPKPLNGMAQAGPARPKDMQAINEHYFGISLSPMEIMFSMVERAVDHLNDKLGLGSDGDQKAAAEGKAWREEALVKNVAVGGSEDFRIPKPGENGVTFRAVAKLVLKMFKSEYLAGDTDLMKALEDSAGFRLNGMNALDLFKAFAEPDGNATKRVHDAIAEGLGSLPGSKIAQRLERATEGTKSAEEALADQKKSSIDVVDDETIAEDQKALEAAKAREKIAAAEAIPEKVQEALKEAEAKQGSSEANGSHTAAAIVQALSGIGAATTSAATSSSNDAPVTDMDIEGIARKAAASELAEHGKDKSLRGLLANYLEFIGSPIDEDWQRPAKRL